MTRRFNPAPGWPTPPAGWTPPPGWQPDPNWPAAPPGWQLWLQELEPGVLWEGESQTLTAAATGGKVAARYRLTEQFLYFERGFLSTDAQQVPIANVLDVDVKQTMTQKARGVGDVLVHIQRPSGVEVVPIESVRDFRQVQRLINETAHAARAAMLRAQNTHHYASNAPQQQGSHVARPTEHDVMVLLKQLGDLKAAGILTEQEFQEKKSELLKRL